MTKALHVGVTGGIGSGKSTVAALLAQKGAVVIDADAISRSTTATGGAAIPAIVASFGLAMLTPEGALDRAQMRNCIFSDPAAKARLEAIIHPLVAAQITRATLMAEQTGTPCIVFDIPLLVESGHWRSKLDKILVVDCSEATQVARATQRSGLSAEEVKKIIASQTSRAERLRVADVVIDNENISLEYLASEVEKIASQFGL
jgi:dephospho-CoA kinase